MGAKEEAWAWLKLNGSHYERGLKEQKRVTERFRRDVNAELRKVAIVVGSLAIATSAIGAGFEQQQARIKAVTNASVEDMRRLESQSRQLGATTEHTATQAAQGQENLLRTGFKVNQVLAMMPGNLALASAGQRDMAFTAELQAAAHKAFSIAAEESTRVVNVLQAATANSRFDLERLNEAIKSGGPVAATWGLEIEESVAAMGVLVDVLGDGSSAGTSLRMALTELTAAQRDQKGVLGEVLAEWNPASEGIVGAVERLERAGISATTVLGEMGARAGPGMAILMQRGSAAIRQLEEDITGTDAAFAAASIQMDTTQGDIKTLVSAVQELALRVFEQIKGPLRSAIQTATRTIQENYDKIVGAVEVAIEATRDLMVVFRDLFALVADHSDVFGSLAKGIGVATVAMYALGTATAVWAAVTKATPLGWIAAAIGIIAAAVDFVVQKIGGWQLVWVAFSAVNKAIWSDLTTRVKLFILQIQTLGEVALKLPEAFDQADKILDETYRIMGRRTKAFFMELGEGIKRALKFQKNPFSGLDELWREGLDELKATANSVTIGDVFGGVLDGYEEAKEKLLAANREVQADFERTIAGLRDTATAAGGSGAPENSDQIAQAQESEALLTEARAAGTEARAVLEAEENERQRLRLQALVDMEIEADARRLEADRQYAEAQEAIERERAARIARIAANLYAGVYAAAAKYATLEQVLRLKVGKFFLRAAGEVAAGEIEEKAKVAATNAAFETAAALGAAARYDFAAFAKHGAAAAKYTALAGLGALAANVARNLGAENTTRLDDAYQEAGALGSADATGSGTRGGSISLSQRSAPETVNIYVSTTVNGHILGNFDDVVDRFVVPRLRELQEGGAY